MNFTKENIEKIRCWKKYIDNGHFGNARDIVETYNEVFQDVRRRVAYTTCASCLRRYVREMYNELVRYEEEKEKAANELDKFMLSENNDEAEDNSNVENKVEEKKKTKRKALEK